jgi:hypothetical protein
MGPSEQRSRGMTDPRCLCSVANIWFSDLQKLRDEFAEERMVSGTLARALRIESLVVVGL